MTFSQELKTASQSIIDDIYQDGFIQDMLTGTLSEAAAKFYLRADASYLKEFANIYALLIPKMEKLEDVQFLVEQIQFIVEGEVEANEIIADFVGENYDAIVQEKVWPPSGDHYIKHMYYNAYTKENAAHTIAAMAPCPYVYQVIAQQALKDRKLNNSSVLVKWFEFYSTEMDALVNIFDQLIDRLTVNCSNEELVQIKDAFLQSTIHERRFFNMAYVQEEWNYGGKVNEKA